MSRAPWLEDHSAFEGVGAHELNLRYDAVDGDDDDHWVRPAALYRAQAFLRTITVRPRLDGIDVSHHQNDAGPFHWPTVGAIPTSWGACKLGQSTTYRDPTSSFHRLGMLDAGLRHRGLYHWLSSTKPPVAQAIWYLELLGDLADGEFTMLDAEEAGITAVGCLVWCQIVEGVTRRPVAVYTGAYVSGGSIWQSNDLRASKWGPRPFILAAYTTEARALALPGVKAHPWSSWQWSSDGPVAGVTGRCDENRVDDRAAYDHACGLDVVHAPPIEVEPPPVTPPPANALAAQGVSTMLILAANADDRTDPTRYALNGFGKRHIRTEAEFEMLKRNGLFPAGLTLGEPEWIDGAALATYPDV